MIVRAFFVFILAAALVSFMPGGVLRAGLWPARGLAELFTHGADSCGVKIDDQGVLKIQSLISFPLAMQDGMVIQPVRGEWTKRGGDLLAMMVVALPAWSIPPLSWRRRVVAFGLLAITMPFLLTLDLIVVIQAEIYSPANLHKILSLPLAGSDANLDAFRGMIMRGKVTGIMVDALNSGGRLAIAGMFGLMPSLLLQPPRRVKSAAILKEAECSIQPRLIHHRASHASHKAASKSNRPA